MDFAALQTEFFARGFDYLNDAGTGLTRAKRWINDSYNEICQTADWPFLETSTSGAAPQTLSDLRKVISVHDATNHLPLRPTTRKWIVSTFGDTASVTGSPRFYYVQNTTVNAYPQSGTITIYYLNVPTDLSGSTDTPVIPTRFHDLIVDGAVKRAYEDSDNFTEAQALGQSIAARLENMRSALLTEAKLPDVDDQAQQTVPE